MRAAAPLLLLPSERAKLATGSYSTPIEAGLTLVYRRSVRGDGSWLARISLGSRKDVLVMIGFSQDERASGGLDYASAVAHALQIAFDCRDNALPQGSAGISLLAAVDVYFADALSQNPDDIVHRENQEKSRARLLFALQSSPQLCAIPLHQLREVDLWRWRSLLHEGNGADENRAVSELKSVLGFCWKRYPEQIPSALARIVQRSLKLSRRADSDFDT